MVWSDQIVGPLNQRVLGSSFTTAQFPSSRIRGLQSSCWAKAEEPGLAVTCPELAPLRSVRLAAIGDDLMVTDGQSCGLQRMKSIEVDG